MANHIDARVTMTPDERSAKLLNIFLPYAAQRREQIIKENGRFVHYTSAANALSIIKERRIWMRNTKCMSDYREIQHGADALSRYFSVEPHKQAFAAALNSCHSGAADEVGRYSVNGGRVRSYKPTSHRYPSTTIAKTSMVASRCGVHSAAAPRHASLWSSNYNSAGMRISRCNWR